jgi:hypothetical protein
MPECLRSVSGIQSADQRKLSVWRWIPADNRGNDVA